MNHEQLQGHWKNKTKDFIIQCYQTTNQLFVKTNNQDQEIINGSYYPVDGGIRITFYIMRNDMIETYTGKLFSIEPTRLRLEVVTTPNHPLKHYQKDLWSLYDDCDHENIVLTKK